MMMIIQQDVAKMMMIMIRKMKKNSMRKTMREAMTRISTRMMRKIAAIFTDAKKAFHGKTMKRKSLKMIWA